jgi:hypothetical protein
MKEINPNLNVKVLFEVVDTVPSEIIEINGVKHQRSLKDTGKINNNFNDYMEILEYFKTMDNVDYLIRFQSEFNKQPYIYPIVKKLIEKQDDISKILDPKHKNLRVRAIAYGMHNNDENQNYQIMRITGSDYAGFYQEELLYKPAALLGFPVNQLPSILYTPLVLGQVRNYQNRFMLKKGLIVICLHILLIMNI